MLYLIQFLLQCVVIQLLTLSIIVYNLRHPDDKIPLAMNSVIFIDDIRITYGVGLIVSCGIEIIGIILFIIIKSKSRQ